MPAVQLILLKKQLDELTGLFGQPDLFAARLGALFEQYGDLTYHAGQASKAGSLLPAYRIPVLVMKQLELSLAPQCAARPQEALAIIDLLWADEHLEPRQLACFLLGQAALEPAQPVLERLENWTSGKQDTNLVITLLDRGSQRLRREAPARWLDVLREWMASSDIELRRNALSAALPFIQDRAFENLPPIFNLITPALQHDAASLSAELQKTLTALARRSPVEVGYILRQILASNSDPALLRLVRRCLPAFPAETQARLKTAIQTRSTSLSDAS